MYKIRLFYVSPPTQAPEAACIQVVLYDCVILLVCDSISGLAHQSLIEHPSFSAAGPRLWTTFNLVYGGRDLPSTPLESLSKPIYLANEVLRDSFEYIGAISI